MTNHVDDPEGFARFLDALSGADDTTNRISLPDAANRLHTLDAGDATADPRSGFLDRLEKELGMTTSEPIRSSAPVATATRPRRTPLLRPRIPDAGPLKWFVTAALMLAVGLIATAAIRNGSDDPDPNAFGVVTTPEAMTALAYEPVNIADCTAPARDAGTIWSLIGQTPSLPTILPSIESIAASATPGQVVEYPTEVGAALLNPYPAVGSDVIDGLNATLRQTTACRFYDRHVVDAVSLYWLDGAYYANFSDDFFRRNAFLAGVTKGENGPSTTRALIGMNFITYGPAPWIVEAARLMPDGRAIAIVVAGQPTPSSFGAYGMVFARSGDRWLIDELLPIGPQQNFDANRDAPRTLDIALDDPEGSVIVSGGFDAVFPENRPVTVTVANIGPTPQEFRIDALGVALSIEPGHSISFGLSAPVGAYVMDSYAPPQFEPDGALVRRLEAIIRFVDELTPAAMG